MRSLRHRGTPTRGHSSKAFCLRMLRHLSAYLDDELSRDVCREIRSHLGTCPNCEVFLDSLRKTVTLCRRAPTRSLSRTAKTRIRRQILRATATL